MATQKNTSTPAPSPKQDDTYAKLHALFQWKDDVDADILNACQREVAGEDEMFLNNIIHALKGSDMSEALVREYHKAGGGNFQLMVLCARFYLAGKCSDKRYDDPSTQYAPVAPQAPQPVLSAAV